MNRPKDLREALQRGIVFVALNDGDGDDCRLSTKAIAGYVSVVALSEAFGYSAGYIAIQVKRVRKSQDAAMEAATTGGR